MLFIFIVLHYNCECFNLWIIVLSFLDANKWFTDVWSDTVQNTASLNTVWQITYSNGFSTLDQHLPLASQGLWGHQPWPGCLGFSWDTVHRCWTKWPAQIDQSHKGRECVTVNSSNMLSKSGKVYCYIFFRRPINIILIYLLFTALPTI